MRSRKYIKSINRKYKNKTKKKQLNSTKYVKSYLKNQKLKCISNLSFEEEYTKKLLSCEKKEKDHTCPEVNEKDLIKLFKIPFTPSKIILQDDYYSYINYQWISEQTKLTKKTNKFYTQIDSFRVAQEKVYYELIDIVKNYIKTSNSKESKEIGNLYRSLVNLDRKSAKKNVMQTIDFVENSIKKGDLYEFIANINKNEVISWGCPIVWRVIPDDKDSKKYRNYIDPPELSVYDYLIYIEDNQDDSETKKYKKLFKNTFLRYINSMFNACLGNNHGYKAIDVWEVEYKLMDAMGCTKVKREDPNFYNKLTTKEALKYGFDWELFSKCLGYKHTPDFFICSSLNYLKCGMELLQNNWKTKEWKTYFIYMHLRQIIRFDKKWRDIYYEFNGKFVEGQQIPMPNEIYPVFVLSICFNTYLANQYIKNNNRQREIDYVNNLGKDLLEVFKRIIHKNTWLSPKTKKYALKKLEYLTLNVGSPEELREDPLLEYTQNNPYGNLCKKMHWNAEKYILLEGKKTIDIPMVDWNKFKLVGKQPYIVNAFYTPTENSIYVPLAYLQAPFIDLNERGIEYNLAYIGFTLGHEMSHCLDDLGSKYDYQGNLHNWWTEEDRRKFEKKVDNVIKQYETFAAYDGIKMDASLSTGENLADISGLKIIEQYLMDFQQKNKDNTPIKYLSFSAFFVYIAIQARQKIYDKAVKAQLKINPHPLDKYRTNCPLARLELFKSVYNIKKGDKMYWPSNDTIW